MSLTRSRPTAQMGAGAAGAASNLLHPESLPASSSSGPFSASSSFPSSSSPALSSSLSNTRPRRPSSSTTTATRTSTRRVSSSSATPTTAQIQTQTRARSSSRSSAATSKTGRVAGSNTFVGKSYEKESKFDRLFGSSSNNGGNGGNANGTMNRGRSSNGVANSLVEHDDTSLDLDLELDEQDQEQDEDDTYSTSGQKRRVSASNGAGSRRETSAPVFSGAGKGKKEILRCERCHKVYHHPQSLIKHRWQHTDQWNSASSYGLSKHQTVQALEAAVILSHPDTLSLLPEDKSHWPAAVSPATSGLLGSERLNIEVLRTGSGYSQSVPTAGMYRGGSTSRFGTSLGSMLEEEQEEQGAATGLQTGDDEDESTDSEDDLGVYSSGNRNGAGRSNGAGEAAARGSREDTEMAQMDEEMFSLDLASQSGGTPAGQYAQLPPVTRASSTTNGQVPPSSGLLAYTRNQYINPQLLTSSTGVYPSQSALRASSHSRKQQRGEREQSTASGSTDLSTNSTNSETTHSNETGETGLSATKDHPSSHYQSSHAAYASPHHSHLSVHNHPNGLPNLSISAPVLGFFTEQNPPQATVVSPHLGPTVMTSPLLRPTVGGGGGHPHLVPVPLRQQREDAVPGSSYTAEETAIAEALSSSYNSNPRSFTSSRSSFQHPNPSPRMQGIPLIPQHGRTMSNGRTASGALSSSPYARSPWTTGNIALPATTVNGGQASAGIGAGFSTSFGQAPLGSSFRSQSAAYSTPSPLVRPVGFEQEHEDGGVEDDEIMDMDL